MNLVLSESLHWVDRGGAVCGDEPGNGGADGECGGGGNVGHRIGARDAVEQGRAEVAEVESRRKSQADADEDGPKGAKHD